MSGKIGRPKKIKFQRPKGTQDILVKEQPYFKEILNICEKTARFYNFKKIDTPIIEEAELFLRGVGLSTDIVEKQMYLIRTKGGDLLALRPELTAPIVRAYIENGMEIFSKPIKLWSFGPCFRYEKPQAGRYRQFWQFDFEAIGSKAPVMDVIIILIFLNILRTLKLKNLIVQINSIGDSKCRPYYKKLLVSYLKPNINSLCKDCKRRLKTNPLRILDCKQEKCQKIIIDAPQTIDHLCKECHLHFKEVLEFLDELEIPYRLNPHLARGLDYYTKTVFEIFKEDEKGALAGGGRFDNLVKLLGGKDTPAVGAACGIERIIRLMQENKLIIREEKKPGIFFAQLGNLAKIQGLQIFEKLKKANIQVYESFSKDSLKVQLKKAQRLGVKYALILGQKEALEKEIILRNMKKQEQNTIKLNNIIKELKKLKY